MEPKYQVSDVEVKECFVLLERIDLNKYNDSSTTIDLSNVSYGIKNKYKKRNLPLFQIFSYSEKGPHECEDCGRSFKTLESHKNHLRHHARKKPHECEECGASFYAPNKLQIHIRYRHTKERPYRCAECDSTFVEMGKLKRHVQLCHIGERPYECPFCVYASADNFKLKRHLLVHTGEKPYACDICQAGFSQKRSLQAHKFIHAKIYPFPCDFCPFTSRRKADLNIHTQRLHSENPKKCRRCKKILPDSYSYKVHLKTHAVEKCKCDICPYECNTPGELKVHMYVHTGGKPFQCDECDRAFAWPGYLKIHKNLNHNPRNSDSSSKEKRNKRSRNKARGKAFCHKGMELGNNNSSIEKKPCVENVEKTSDDEFDNDK